MDQSINGDLIMTRNSNRAYCGTVNFLGSDNNEKSGDR